MIRKKKLSTLKILFGSQQYQRMVIGADGLVMKCSNDEENIEIIGDIKKQSA